MAVPISNVTRRVVYAASGVGPYAFTFEILAETDIEVYKADTKLTLTTDYSVTINANGTGSVTLVATAGTDNITIIGARAIQRLSDFVTGGDLFANTINDELDSLTIFAQQNAEGVNRCLQAPETDPTTINMTLPRKSDRADKYLAFDSDGNPVPGQVPEEITAVLAIETEIVTVAGIDTEIVNLEAISGNIETLAPIAANITTVAGISSSVTTVAGLDTEIVAVAANEGNIDIVAGLDTEIAALGPIASSIQAVGNLDAADLIAVGNIEAEVTTVAGIAANVTTVAGISADVTTVSGINAAVSNVSSIGSAVSNVSSISAAVSTVSGISADVSTVAADGTDIGLVAGSIANVNSVATNIASVTAVAGNIDEVITAANDLNEAVSEIEVVANNIAAVDTVGGNIDSVNIVAGNIDSVITVATNVADITNFSDVYLGPAATDPATRNDSSALQAGDLYFNTADDAVKVYTGAAWTVAYVPSDGFLVSANNLSDLTNAATARQNLDLEVGVDVQAYDADTAKLDVEQTWAANQNLADYLLTRATLKDYAIEGVAIGNAGATRTFDLTTGNFFSVTIDQATTFTFSNPPASGDFGTFVMEVTNGGAFVITFPASVDWPGGTAPTLTASGVDQLVFTTRDGGTTYFGFVAGLDIKSP